jgi:hypothetical protein
MTEFGHTAIRMDGAIIDCWGAGPFRIKVGERVYLFEDSDRFGPAILHKRTLNPADRQPGEAHPFWPAWHMWVKGGRKVGEDGLCVWRQPLAGTYWKDASGVSRFLTDPDWEPLGYRRVPMPAALAEHDAAILRDDKARGK